MDRANTLTPGSYQNTHQRASDPLNLHLNRCDIQIWRERPHLASPGPGDVWTSCAARAEAASILSFSHSRSSRSASADLSASCSLTDSSCLRTATCVSLGRLLTHSSFLQKSQGVQAMSSELLEEL